MLPSEIPRGTRMLPPLMAAKRRRLEEALLDVFLRWGFQEVVTPTFEYMDTLISGLGEAYQERLFKLEERHTGQPTVAGQHAKVVGGARGARPEVAVGEYSAASRARRTRGVDDAERVAGSVRSCWITDRRGRG